MTQIIFETLHSIQESRSPSAPLAGRDLDEDAAARTDRRSRARGAREERERHGVWEEDGEGRTTMWAEAGEET